MTEITPAMAGTWLDGAQGWHNTYRVIDIAEEYGQTFSAEDRRAVEAFRRNQGVFADADGRAQQTADVIDEIADEATDYLQSLAPEGYVFEWSAGELTLTQSDSD